LAGSVALVCIGLDAVLCRWFGIVPELVRVRFGFDPLLVRFKLLIRKAGSLSFRFSSGFGSLLIRPDF
jgi:hypothetical protein